ncbi:MAG: hypothetical protein ACKPCP_34120, partial [Sphaerospermopsis kisseleviana]
MDTIRSENNHLIDFTNEMGWKEDSKASLVRISTLYDYLKKWYIDQGIYDEFRNAFLDPIKPSDQYVKGSNQLFDRLKVIFPAITKVQKTPLGGSKKVPHIGGLSILLNTTKQLSIPTPTHRSTDPTPVPTPTPTPIETGSKPVSASVLTTLTDPPTPVFSKSSEINSIEQLDPKTRAEIPPKNSNNDDSGENKERLGNIGVGGVGKMAETPTTQGLPPNNFGVGTGVGVGVGTGVGTGAFGDLIGRIKVADADPQQQKRDEFKQQQQQEHNHVVAQANLVLGFLRDRKYKSAFDILADGRVKAAVTSLLRQPENSQLYADYLGQVEVLEELGEVWDLD